MAKKSIRIVLLTALLLLSTLTYLHFMFAERLSIQDPAFIEDNAGLFDEESLQAISDYHTMLLDQFSVDYRVVTMRQTPDIDRFAVDHFRASTVGSKSDTNRGLLLVIDTENDMVRMEVSANLESVFTDAFIHYVEEYQMVPYFRASQVVAGILGTGELIRLRALEAKQGHAFDLSTLAGTAGGGAQTPARIAAGKDPSYREGQADVLAGDTPEEALERLFDAYRTRNARDSLDVLTPESRRYMGDKVVTAAQMDNVVKRYRDCEVEHVTYDDAGIRAVLFHSLARRECDPFLFERGEDGKWRIDLKTLGLGLGHTFGNIWYIDYERVVQSGIWKYDFGFRHLRFRRPKGEQFDHQGIPYYRSFGLHINHVFEGSVIKKVHDDSFMARQDIREGDVILRWEDAPFPHNNLIHQRMQAVRPGLDIRMVIRRGGQVLNKIVKAPPYPQPGKARFGVTHGSPGPKIPLVHYVEPGSQSHKLGLQEGDLITRWQEVHNPSTVYVYNNIRDLRAGDAISVDVLRAENTLTLEGTAASRRTMGRVH